MKQILWFRRDLRIKDSAILHFAQGEVFPIFIFDTNILNKLPKDDKRVTFIYQSVLSLQHKLQSIGLDLAIFYGDPKEIFSKIISNSPFETVLCSCDFDSYAIQRDKEIEKMLPMQRYYDSYLIDPRDGVKKDNTPYKVFTPFYKNFSYLWQSDCIEEYSPNPHLKLFPYEYNHFLSLEEMGFETQKLPPFLYQTADELLQKFVPKLANYQHDRDYFAIDGTSKLSTHLRFGLISAKQIFNRIKPHPHSEFFIRELFWREFYNTILFHFPRSEFENFNQKNIPWDTDEKLFQAWCKGETGVPIIDAAMIHLNQTGMMHNRLRMIVASFFTKNLFLPWQWGEQYFALKLLDYDASSNIGSWQWGASTGADSVPYFRIFNPISQMEKFDKDGSFIHLIFPHFKPEDFHPIVDLQKSRQKAIDIFKSL